MISIKRIDKFLGIWLLLNFIQAIITPILKDEAYYWLFSKYLDWGYYDHPPMVAYIIKIGTLLFGDSFIGIRFITVLLSVGFGKILWELIPEKMKQFKGAELLFIAILTAIPIFHVYGFITTPDAPLLFFSVLFLFSVNRLEQYKSLGYTLLLGFSAGLLILSKYHGGVIILITLLMKPRLFKLWQSYLAAFLGILIITPHIIWQIEHDFISFTLHLLQRASRQFKISQTAEYLGGTLAVLNPILLFTLTKNILFKKT